MQISKINTNSNFGGIIVHLQDAPPPAIIKECSVNTLKQAASYIKESQILKDLFVNRDAIIPISKKLPFKKPVNPLDLLKEKPREFAEFTDSRMKILRPRRTFPGYKIFTIINSHKRGRTDIAKTPLIRKINQPPSSRHINTDAISNKD